MTIDDVCRNWDYDFGQRAMVDFLDDLPEQLSPRSTVPQIVLDGTFRDQVEWLVNQCEPPFTPEEIHDYMIECQLP